MQLGTIEEQIAKGVLAAPPPVPKTRTELEEWGDDLEKENATLQQERKKRDEERRQLREDEEALESQIRDMEVPMAREPERIARRETERFLRFDHRVGETAARGQRTGPAVMAAGVGGRRLERRVERALRFLEQPEGPQRVAVERQRGRVGGLPFGELLGLKSRAGEIARAQQHERGPRLRPARERGLRGRGGERALIGVGGVAVARFAREQVAELQLDVGRSRLRRLRRERHQRRDQRRGESDDQRGLPHAAQYSKKAAYAVRKPTSGRTWRSPG